jgi:hypothetical protein
MFKNFEWHKFHNDRRALVYSYFLGMLIFSILIFLFGGIKTGGCTSAPLWEGFPDCLEVIDYPYFSIVTITTLGYGDIAPVAWYSKLFVALLSLFGLYIMGMFITAVGIKGASIRESQADLDNFLIQARDMEYATSATLSAFREQELHMFELIEEYSSSRIDRLRENVDGLATANNILVKKSDEAFIAFRFTENKRLRQVVDKIDAYRNSSLMLVNNIRNFTSGYDSGEYYLIDDAFNNIRFHYFKILDFEKAYLKLTREA